MHPQLALIFNAHTIPATTFSPLSLTILPPSHPRKLTASSQVPRNTGPVIVAYAVGESNIYLLDIIIAQGAPILKLLAREDQPLLVRRDALLILDLGLDVVDRVAGLDFEGDGLAREGLDEDLHCG